MSRTVKERFDCSPTALNFHADFNFVIFTYRQTFAKIIPAVISPQQRNLKVPPASISTLKKVHEVTFNIRCSVLRKSLYKRVRFWWLPIVLKSQRKIFSLHLKLFAGNKFQMNPPLYVMWYISNTRKCFIRYPNGEKWVEKRGAAEFFFYPLRGVWFSDEILVRVFAIAS